jgi:hypothetical protein
MNVLSFRSLRQLNRYAVRVVDHRGRFKNNSGTEGSCGKDRVAALRKGVRPGTEPDIRRRLRLVHNVLQAVHCLSPLRLAGSSFFSHRMIIEYLSNFQGKRRGQEGLS